MNSKIKIKSIEGIAGFVEFLEKQKNDALFLLEIPDVKIKTKSVLYPDNNPKHLFFFRDGLPTLFSPEEKDLKMLIEIAGITPKQKKRKSRKGINLDVLHQVIIKQRTLIPILKCACAKSGKLITTDLSTAVITDTDLEDGIYERIGKDWVKSSKYTIEHFPKIDMNYDKTKAIEIVFTKNLIKRLLWGTEAVNTSNRPYSISIHFKVKNNVLYVFTTNGNKLVCERFNTDLPDFEFTTGSDMFLRLLSKFNEVKAKLIFTKKELIVEFDSGIIIASSFHEKYPNVFNIIPMEVEKAYRFNRDSLLNVLTDLIPYTNKKEHFISLDFENGKIEAGDADNPERYKSTDIPITEVNSIGKWEYNVSGVAIMPLRNRENPNLQLNGKWLLNLVKTMNNDIIINVKDNESPVVILEAQ